jgi:hypothetical protein
MLRKKIGDFYLVEHLGSGGMSDVYLAVSPRTREKRAFKIVTKRASAAPTCYARFLREVEIVRRLEHPNIVSIYESGEINDFYYYGMEYMPGGNLARRLGKKKIPLPEAIHLVCNICAAMAYAHEKGIIHRDIKPANILLDAAGTPKVADFGIAKIIEEGRETLTRSGEILGTIAYLAPEQRFDTKRVDRRADIFALGAILYEMIMGFPPLGNFPWPREIQPDFPDSVQCILEKCLALNPIDRFKEAGILLIELEECRKTNVENRIVPGMNRTPSALAKHQITAFQPMTDRIEHWFLTLRSGTTRERLAVVREMVDTMEPREASAIIKLYAGEGERVRWGLMRALGDLKITAATPLLLNELKNPFHAECAVEALGKIGADDAFDSIREYVDKNPDSALVALVPMALTGKRRAVEYLKSYLKHEMAIVRQCAVRALAMITCDECLQILKDHLSYEMDDKIRSTLNHFILSLERDLSSSANFSIHNTEALTKQA